MRCFSISNSIGIPSLDDWRETRGDHHDVLQRSSPDRASKPYHGVAPLPINASGRPKAAAMHLPV